MKIQKQVSKIIENKKYYKYVVVLPENIIRKSGFRKGQEIKVEAKKGEIRLKKKNQDGAE